MSAEGQSPVLFSVQTQHADKPCLDAITKARLKQQTRPSHNGDNKTLQVGSWPNLEMANPPGQRNPRSASESSAQAVRALMGTRKFLVQ